MAHSRPFLPLQSTLLLVMERVAALCVFEAAPASQYSSSRLLTSMCIVSVLRIVADGLILVRHAALYLVHLALACLSLWSAASGWSCSFSSPAWSLQPKTSSSSFGGVRLSVPAGSQSTWKASPAKQAPQLAEGAVLLAQP